MEEKLAVTQVSQGHTPSGSCVLSLHGLSLAGLVAMILIPHSVPKHRTSLLLESLWCYDSNLLMFYLTSSVFIW